MAHSDCGWTCGCAGKTVKSLENTCHTWALLQWWFTTKRRFMKCMHHLSSWRNDTWSPAHAGCTKVLLNGERKTPGPSLFWRYGPTCVDQITVDEMLTQSGDRPSFRSPSTKSIRSTSSTWCRRMRNAGKRPPPLFSPKTYSFTRGIFSKHSLAVHISGMVMCTRNSRRAQTSAKAGRLVNIQVQ